MATIKFKDTSEYALKLSRLANQGEVAKKALYEGAKIVADTVKREIEGIPTTEERGTPEKKVNGILKRQKTDLKKSFGITPMRDDGFSWNVKLGFDGYGSQHTKKYPKGVPNQLLARSVESGTSFREKYPFMRKAVNKGKKAAIEKMEEVIEKECEKIMRGG